MREQLVDRTILKGAIQGRCNGKSDP